MNRIVWDYLDRRMSDSRGSRNDSRRDYRRGGRMDRRDYESTTREYGHGPEDSRDYRRMRDYEDERDYRRDYEDGHDVPLELSKSDIYEWKHAMKNADGSKGGHYDLQQVVQAADKIGVHFKDFDEKELCITTNMLYSDYCTVLAKYIPHEKMLTACVELAKAFLEDEDAPAGSEKLALYYHCIVCSESV